MKGGDRKIPSRLLTDYTAAWFGQRSKSHRMVKNFVRKSKSAVEKVSEWDGLYWTFDNKRSAGAYSAFDQKVHRTMMMGEDGKQKLPEDLVITCGDDRTVALWSMDTGELVRRMCGHQREITDLALFKGSCPEGGGPGCRRAPQQFAAGLRGRGTCRL